jgi:dipeptidase D
MSVRNLEPKIVWNHFEDLNAVPRPSKKEERIRQFMVDFGKGLGLETTLDKIGNVIIKKAATRVLKIVKRLFSKRTLTWYIKKMQPPNLIFLRKEFNLILMGNG